MPNVGKCRIETAEWLRTASDVHRWSFQALLRQLDQFKRWRRIVLKPADFIFAFGGVDVFPMGSTADILHDQPFRSR